MHRLPLPLLSLLAATTTFVRITTVDAAAAQKRAVDRSTPFGLPLLFVRQVANDACSPLGQKVCGTNCIQLDATCCPDGAGGCPASAQCQLGTNGQYGCCPNGQTCTGAGTAIITTPNSQPTNGLGLTCPAGRKLCGIGCILNLETCCPGGGGGCPVGQSCALGNNRQYGCCPNGQICTGPGGTSPNAVATVTITAKPNSAATLTGTTGLGSASATAAATVGAPTTAGGGLASPTGGIPLNSESDGKKSNTGPIVGGVVGGIAALGIIGALIFFFVIKPRGEKNKPANVAPPPPSSAYNQSAEPKPDAAVLGAGVSGHHPSAHEMPAPIASPQLQQQQHQHQQGYPSSPQWSPPPSAGYPPSQPYSPQGNHPQYQQYPAQQPLGYPAQSPPPLGGGGFVPQPGHHQQQPQQFYQGYPAGSPAANSGYNYPPQPHQQLPQHPQQPQQPPVELPGGQR